MGALDKIFKYLLIVTILFSIVYVSNSIGLFWITVFLISIGTLIKSSDYFTEAAEKLGLVIGIPQFIVGVTIVSIGTSLPELMTSLIAVFRGVTEFVAGNAIGSNIANILLVIGAAAIFAKKTMKVEWSLIDVDLPLLLICTFVLYFCVADGMFTFGEAVLCLLGYLIYTMYVISTRTDDDKSTEKFKWSIIVTLILSSVGIFFGAQYTIDSIIAIINLPFFIKLGIDTSMIALSAVALGTSLPELTVSISAAKKGNYEMALGNVIGSNIFNSFVVMGIPALISPLVISSTILTLAVPFMIAATFVLIVSILDKSISKYEGAMFVLLYVLFIIKLMGGQ